MDNNIENNLISIIIPVYNDEKNIETAIKSAQNQTYKNIEIIVINDASTDSTADIVKHIANNNSRIKYIRNTTNKNAALSRNIGIANSEGEFIAFLDSDDTWEKDKLEKQIELFQDEKIGLVYSDGKLFGENKKKSGKLFSDFTTFRRGDAFSKLITTNFIPTSSVIIKKKVVDNVGDFQVDPRLRVSEDYDLWLRISQKYSIDYVPEPLINYQTSSTGLSGSKITNYRCMLYLYKTWIQKKNLSYYQKFLITIATAKTYGKLIITKLRLFNN